ncbi:hypothetical protein pEaSNUABM38_00003 [Erwinia phage pEa_SNUABM_38]|nr:hypothetical protein pEaSNUABM38_00003 [Erwinia phage pEa_SNUABM_38]
MSHLENQLRNFHMSSSQSLLLRQLGVLDNDAVLDSSDTTAIERKAILQLAQDVLNGKKLYQVRISSDGEGPRPPAKRKLCKLDLGGYVYTDSYAVSTMTFALVFGMAIRTYVHENQHCICVAEDGEIQFNLSMLGIQYISVSQAFTAMPQHEEISDKLGQITAFIKATLLARGRVKFNINGGLGWEQDRHVLAHYIPRRGTWKEYKQSMIVKLPFLGEMRQIDMLVDLSDIVSDALPRVTFLYQNIDGDIISLEKLTPVPTCKPEDYTTDVIFSQYHDTVLLTAALFDIKDNVQEIELLNTFKFYYKG